MIVYTYMIAGFLATYRHDMILFVTAMKDHSRERVFDPQNYMGVVWDTLAEECYRASHSCKPWVSVFGRSVPPR